MHVEVSDMVIVLGVIGADVHAVGIRVLESALVENGFQVINLGVLNAQKDFIEAAIETNADAILVSSMYGHAELDCEGFWEKCQESGLEDMLLYIGGNLKVGQENFSEVEQRFKKMGFIRVAPPETDPKKVVQWLKEDITYR